MDKIKHWCGLCSLIVCLCTLLSCTEKAPINGDLDGNWQLLRMVDNGTGEEVSCNRMYWAIQLWVAELNDRGEGKSRKFIARFVYDEAKQQVYMKDFNSNGGQLVNEVADEKERLKRLKELARYGITSTEAVFDVVQADGNRLILRSAEKTLHFRKF